jgi:photosystem II stability/assembly factor-like uncharacterized protein
MTDNYESQLRARLGALERAVPVSSEEALAGQTIRGRARVRSALPVGSLVAAGLVALIVVGIAPRLAPAGVGASPWGAPSESAPAWNPGAMMLPQLAPNGAGYTYVDGTGLFVTADYGATWSGPRQIPAGDSPQDHLWDMGTLDFADGQHGWMTGVTNGVTGSKVSEYRTDDGGQTWKSVPIAMFTETAQPAGTEGNWVFATQHFVDALRGRLQVGRQAGAQEPSACAEWVTADGGVSWARTEDVQCLASPKWVTPTLGYGRSGAGASIWVTQDGGVSWRSGELPGAWSTYSFSMLAQESNGTLTLVVASGSSSTQPPMAVMASDDGGTSWRLAYEVDPAKQTQAIAVPDGLALASPARWTLLAGNSLWESRDAGLTWSKVGEHRFNDPQGTAWWDEQHGAMLDGEVLVTSDGGQTWRQVNF